MISLPCICLHYRVKDISPSQATSRTGTMQEEQLNEVPPDYELVAMTVFSSTFGGAEAAAILESEIAEE